MRFLLAPFGSAGDVHPVVGVGLELKKRGHDVVVAVNEIFKPIVLERGLGYIELGTAEQFRAVAAHPDIWNPQKALTHLFRNGVVPAMRPHFELTRDFCREKDGFSITSILGFGGLMAAEKCGANVATVHLQPAALWSKLDPPTLPGLFGPNWWKGFLYDLAERFMIGPKILPTLNAFRRELELSPVTHLTRWWHSKSAVFCLFPSWFAAKPADWPAAAEVIDFPLWEETLDQPLDAALVRFLDQGDPPIVFTPGSANVFGAEFFKAADEATRRIDRRAVYLSRHQEQLPNADGRRTLSLPYASFTQLLPRAAALVHHGGIGSAAQGMAAGIPQLVMALAHDQFDNGERMRKLGVGDWLPKKRFTPKNVAERLDALLRSPSVRESTAAVARRLVPRDGAQKAADAICAWTQRIR